MRKSPMIFLDHIINSINLLEEYIQDLKYQDFVNNYEKQDAVIRRLEIMGEAIRNIPEEFLDNYPEIPWRDIVDFRNVLIHEYFDVNIERVWETIQKDIPEFKTKIEKIRKSLEL
ncbi:MAG: DUF86 domain-containing protein [Patescibacteria group bacterium]